jgi:hypothetical protein
MSTTPRLQALLQAARAEQPPDGNAERVLGALGVGPGSTSRMAVARGAMRTWLRAIGFGVVLALISWAGARAIARYRSAGAEVARSLPDARIERDDPPALAPIRLEGRSVAERAATPRPCVPASPGTHAPALVARVRPAAPSDDELTLLGEAKLALRRGDARAALSVLADHAREFPRGDFLEEAAALRIEAAAAGGRGDEGRRMADAFDAAYPKSPYGPRIDALRKRMEPSRGRPSRSSALSTWPAAPSNPLLPR